MKYILFALCLFIMACNQSERENVKELASQWNSREVLFPDSISFTTNLYDTVDYKIDSKLKVFYYVDTLGCSSCKLNLEGWKRFKIFIDKISNNSCAIIIVFEPKNKIIIRDISTRIIAGDIQNYFVLDTCSLFNNLNNFPLDDRFSLFPP